MNIDISTEKLFDLIIEKLNNQEPLSITRIGDGEVFVLNQEIREDLTIHTYKRHLGYIPEYDEKKIIQDNLKYSIENSEILSINPNITKNTLGWGQVLKIYEEIKKLSNSDWQEKKFCDHNVHHYFLELGYYKKILSSINELYIISCRDVVNIIKEKYPNIKKITFFKIPPENMFEEDKDQLKYFPEIYDEIFNEISNIDCKGKLLLLGGGFVGKRLGVRFKEMGGVSFDIGSVFDLWVGKITRGPNKGINSYTEPKL